jgi:ankyrin repeat protein
MTIRFKRISRKPVLLLCAVISLMMVITCSKSKEAPKETAKQKVSQSVLPVAQQNAKEAVPQKAKISTAEQEALIKQLEEKGLSFTKESFYNEIRANNMETVALFVKAGIGLEGTDETGKLNAMGIKDHTALMVALNSEHMEMAKFLIENGSDINATDAKGASMLWVAAGTGDLERAKFLIDNGADVNFDEKNIDPILIRTAVSHQPEMAEYLISKGANVNGKNKHGRTPLMAAAAQERNINLVKLFIKNGADVNARTSKGASALMIASRMGGIEIAKTLIEHGADIHIKDNEGKSLFAVSSEYMRNFWKSQGITE